MKTKYTQEQLVLIYLFNEALIYPAKKANKQLPGFGYFGSELPRVARRMRSKGLLDSYTDGRFTAFHLTMKGNKLVSKIMHPNVKGD